MTGSSRVTRSAGMSNTSNAVGAIGRGEERYQKSIVSAGSFSKRRGEESLFRIQRMTWRPTLNPCAVPTGSAG
jgi:hypothetical protein